jgi:hypothetical protein
LRRGNDQGLYYDHLAATNGTPNNAVQPYGWPAPLR